MYISRFHYSGQSRIFGPTVFIKSLMVSGDVPRVDGQLAVARAFGDKSLKRHLSSEPDIKVEMIDDDVEFIILASDGLWKVHKFSNDSPFLCLIGTRYG